MGIVIGEVVFVGKVPEPAAIQAAMTRQCGLPVIMTEGGPAITDDLYEFDGRLAFAAAASNSIEIFAYRPGAVRRLYNQLTADGELLPERQLKCITGWDQAPGTQSVHLRGYLGQEMTLFMVALITLESLGGRPKHPISERARRLCSGPISNEELARRIRKERSLSVAGTLISVAFLPLMLLQLLCSILILPVRLWKARRPVLQELQEYDQRRRAAQQPDAPDPDVHR